MAELTLNDLQGACMMQPKPSEDLIDCILTGHKGEFKAVAKDRRFCVFHGRDIYTVKSVCGKVSINVFATNVEHKNKQFLNGGWPVEFYYS